MSILNGNESEDHERIYAHRAELKFVRPKAWTSEKTIITCEEGMGQTGGEIGIGGENRKAEYPLEELSVYSIMDTSQRRFI